MKVIRSLSFPRLVLWTGVTLCVGSLVLVPWRLTAQESDALDHEPEPEKKVVTKITAIESGGDDILFPEIQESEEIHSPEDESHLDDLFSEDESTTRKKQFSERKAVERRVTASDDPFLGGNADQNYKVFRYTTSSTVQQQDHADAGNLAVLKAELEAAEAEMALSEHRFNRLRDLRSKKAVSEEEVVKAHAEFARARAQLARATARLEGGQQIHSYRIQQQTHQTTDKDRMIQALREEVESLKRQLQMRSLSRPKVAPPGLSANSPVRLYDSFGGAGNRKRVEMNQIENNADYGVVTRDSISKQQRAQELELIEEEIELAERQLALQQEKYKAGQVSEDQVLAMRREILSLKRQKIRLGSGVSTSGSSSRNRKRGMDAFEK